MTAETKTKAEQPWWREPTRPQWASFGAAWFGWVLDAFDFTIFLIVMRDIEKEFGVSMVATTGSLALTLVLRLLGGAVAGAAADRWGRKLPLLISIIWFAVCDAAIAFAPSFAMVLLLRALFGFGMGAEWTAGTTLAMENWPVRSRGIASGILQGSWAVGYLLAAAAAEYIVPAYGWRALFLVAAAPALLVLPMRIWVPESPEWVAGKAERARKPIPFKEVFARGNLKGLAFGAVAMSLGMSMYYGITALYPALLDKVLAVGISEKASLIKIFNVGMMVGALTCGWIAVRRNLTAAVVLPMALLLPILPLYVGWIEGGLSYGSFLAGMFGAGISGVTPLMLTQLFPARIRARSVGLVYHVGACVAAFVPMAMAGLVEGAGLALGTVIAAVATTCALALIPVMIFRPRIGESAEPSPERPESRGTSPHDEEPVLIH